MVSANQFADNAATQAIKASKALKEYKYDQCFYPPFSPRWCFSFEGKLATKGATKVLREKMDEELILRQQHREKQGLFFRLAPFTNLSAEYIGDQSILRSIVKMTAECWTRRLYRNPSLANLMWKRWRDTQHHKPYFATLPEDVPKDWQKRPVICNFIIKACPLCSCSNSTDNMKGNLEHLHIYCPSRPLEKVRNFCNQKIEQALLALYDFAAMRQYQRPFEDCNRTTFLQENMTRAAKEAELEKRPIAEKTNKTVHLKYEARATNIAIKSRADVQCEVLLQRLPSSKLSEFEAFPLSSQLGFLIATPEKDYNIGTATITDVGFMGLFPKQVSQVMNNYAQDMERSKEDSSGFRALQSRVVNSLIYRAVTIQKIIHVLLVAFQNHLHDLDKRREENRGTSGSATTQPAPSNTPPGSSMSRSPSMPSTRICYASKCRILQAKGILRGPMFCAKNRNTCSGCAIEAAKQAQVAQAERDLLQLTINNEPLIPLLDHRVQPISNKTFRQIWHCLPTFGKRTRNDLKFGVATYLANTLGILIEDASSSHTMDEPLSRKQANDLWRQASHFCKCLDPISRHAKKSYGIRAFCEACEYIIPVTTGPKCPGCNLQESFLSDGTACLACQFATMVFRNPYHRRFAAIIDKWLSLSDSGSSTTTYEHTPQRSTENNPKSLYVAEFSHQDLLKMRTLSFERSFSEIRLRSTPEENKLVITNISMIQRDIRQQNSEKRDLESLQLTSQNTSQAEDDTLSPRKRGALCKTSTLQDNTEDLLQSEDASVAKKLFSDSSCVSYDNPCRPPLAPLDMNSVSDITRWKKGSSNQTKRHERMMRAKARRKEVLD